MRFAAVAVAAILAGVGTALASTSKTRPLPGLPAYTAGFESWPRLNRRPIPPRQSDPHHGTKNVYVNQPLRRIAPDGRQRYPYPYGTVVVKTAARGSSRAYSLVAVMRKVRRANPRHNDWVMVEYTRTTPNSRFRQLAAGSICTGCHVQAKRRDYVFTRLRR
jgi:Cytochrome P460